MWYLFCLSLGACVGSLVCSVLTSGKVSDLYDEIARLKDQLKFHVDQLNR